MPRAPDRSRLPTGFRDDTTSPGRDRSSAGTRVKEPQDTLIDRVELVVAAALARVVLASRRPLIIGITGSVGKTTTKEVLGRTLAHERVQPVVGPVWRTPANRNARFQFLLALLVVDRPASTIAARLWRLAIAAARALTYVLPIREYPRVLVLEYAMRVPGHIRWRTSVARPDIAIVTAVGAGHLEHLGSVERIADEKAALVRAVRPDGLVLLGADNALAAAMQAESAAPCILVRGAGRPFAEAVTRIVGDRLGVAGAAIAAALADVGDITGRQHVQDAGPLTVIDDSFNANPLSMRYGLDQLAERAAALGPGRRRVAILGDMLELGPDAPHYHADIGAHARETADLVLAVGPLAQHYDAPHWFATAAECAAALDDVLAPGDVVLVKGSRGVNLGVVARAAQQLGAAMAASREGDRGGVSGPEVARDGWAVR